MDSSTFEQHFVGFPTILAKRIFDVFIVFPILSLTFLKTFDMRGEGKFDFVSFIVGLAMCCKGTKEEKLECKDIKKCNV